MLPINSIFNMVIYSSTIHGPLILTSSLPLRWRFLMRAIRVVGHTHFHRIFIHLFQYRCLTKWTTPLAFRQPRFYAFQMKAVTTFGQDSNTFTLFKIIDTNGAHGTAYSVFCAVSVGTCAWGNVVRSGGNFWRARNMLRNWHIYLRTFRWC